MTIPVPADVGLMEWDDHFEAQMVANTSLSLSEATAFYENAMQQQGWIAREAGRKVDADVVYLPYYFGQQDITIALEQLADGLVRIRTGNYSSSSWQKPEDQTSGNSDSESAPAEPEEGIEAADLPILHAAGAPTYREDAGGSVRFELDKTSLKDLADQYRESLTKLGWTAKPFGEPQEDFVSIHFERGSKILYYQSMIDPRGKGFLEFSGNGLLWSKPIASTQLIPYSAWLRNRKYPASLKRLDEYQAEMEKLVNGAKSP